MESQVMQNNKMVLMVNGPIFNDQIETFAEEKDPNNLFPFSKHD